jgi:hypothetical protein
MVKAQYGVGFWIITVLLVGCTCGIGLIIWAWMRTMWIDEANDEGVTTVSGRKFAWSELTNVGRTTVTAVGARVGRVGGLHFGGKRVLVNSMLVANADEVLAFIEKKIGTRVA